MNTRGRYGTDFIDFFHIMFGEINSHDIMEISYMGRGGYGLYRSYILYKLSRKDFDPIFIMRGLVK